MEEIRLAIWFHVTENLDILLLFLYVGDDVQLVPITCSYFFVFAQVTCFLVPTPEFGMFVPFLSFCVYPRTQTHSRSSANTMYDTSTQEYTHLHISRHTHM